MVGFRTFPWRSLRLRKRSIFAVTLHLAKLGCFSPVHLRTDFPELQMWPHNEIHFQMLSAHCPSTWTSLCMSHTTEFKTGPELCWYLTKVTSFLERPMVSCAAHRIKEEFSSKTLWLNQSLKDSLNQTLSKPVTASYFHPGFKTVTQKKH